MKNDNKVFPIYILILVVYGVSYWITSGKSFAFSPDYSDVGLGIISFALFFNKRINKYSFLLVALGFSLLYLIAANPEFRLIDKSGFIQLKNYTLMAFSLIVLWDVYRGRYVSLKSELTGLSVLILGYFGLKFIEWEFTETPEYSLCKNLVGFLIVGWVLRKNETKHSLSTPLKRIIIVIGLSFFIEMMTYFVLNS